MSENSLLFILFLGAGWLLAKEGHVKVDVLLSQLNPKGQALVNAITSILGAIICLVIVWYGIQCTWDHFQRGVLAHTALELPVAPILAIIPVGSFMLFIQFLRRVYGYIGGWRSLSSKEQGV